MTTTATTPQKDVPPWLKALGEQLQNLPEDLAKHEEDLNKVVVLIEDLTDEYKIKEADFLSAVTLEMDPSSSKPRYPNAELRAGELARRLREDDDCTKIRTQLKELRTKRDSLRVQGTLIANKFSGAKVRANLLAAWMSS